MPSTRDYLAFAFDAAFQAGRLVLGHFQADITIDRKADESPVTVADREGEALLRRLIEKKFPAHGIYGEEMGESDRDASHRWILDPIDGTRSFVRGVPLFGVLVGLEIDREMVVGVCYLPALDEMIGAGRGEGCYWNGRRAAVSSASALEDSLVSLTEPGSLDVEHRAFWERLKECGATIRGFSDCYGHCLVATGRCDVMLDPVMNPWDCGALLPIIEEAGGRFTDWTGEPTIYGGSAISTNGVLHAELMRLLD